MHSMVWYPAIWKPLRRVRTVPFLSRLFTRARLSWSAQRAPFSRRILSSFSGAVASSQATKSSKTSALSASKPVSSGESSQPELPSPATLREM